MKRILTILFLSIFSICHSVPCFAVAEDKRLSDNDGDVLGINSDGSIPVTLSGTLAVANGGTGVTSVSDNAVLVGNNAGTGFDKPALPNCTDATGNHLNYVASTGNFVCGTSIRSTAFTFSRVDATNQACNTTCGALICVAGFSNGGVDGQFLEACDGTAADRCICLTIS